MCMIYLRRITNITPRKHHDAALDFSFPAITETDVPDVIEIINPWKSPVGTLLLYLSSLRKLLPLLLHLWGPYSTTILLRASDLRRGKWGNGHLYSKRETNKPKKIIA